MIKRVREKGAISMGQEMNQQRTDDILQETGLLSPKGKPSIF